jgi:hypothetical protein
MILETIRGLVSADELTQARYRLSRVTLKPGAPGSPCPDRFVEHNPPGLHGLHFKLTPRLQPYAPVPIMPSYVFASRYPAGVWLTRHTDRENCAFTCSLVLEAKEGVVWPLWFEVDGRLTSVSLNVGDAVFYERALPHWREPLPRGEVTVLLFHFVPVDHLGTLD